MSINLSLYAPNREAAALYLEEEGSHFGIDAEGVEMVSQNGETFQLRGPKAVMEEIAEAALQAGWQVSGLYEADEEE